MNIFNKLKVGSVGLFCFFMTAPVFAAYSMSFQEKIKLVLNTFPPFFFMMVLAGFLVFIALKVPLSSNKILRICQSLFLTLIVGSLFIFLVCGTVFFLNP